METGGMRCGMGYGEWRNEVWDGVWRRRLWQVVWTHLTFSSDWYYVDVAGGLVVVLMSCETTPRFGFWADEWCQSVANLHSCLM